MIDWLDWESGDDDSVLYPLLEAKARWQVKELVPGWGWLVLNIGEHNWIKFAVLQYAKANGDGSDIKTCVLFHGEGPSGALRECRHTYWGDERGYIFYPKGHVISAAFAVLAEYYDDMVKPPAP